MIMHYYFCVVLESNLKCLDLLLPLISFPLVFISANFIAALPTITGNVFWCNIIIVKIINFDSFQSIVWQFVLIGFAANVISVILHAITIYGIRLGFTYVDKVNINNGSLTSIRIMDAI